MPKKVTKRAAPKKCEKVDLGFLEGMSIVTLCLVLFSAAYLMIELCSISDKVEEAKYEASWAKIHAEKAREYSYAAKAYSYELYKKSQKKKASKK